MQHVKRLCWCQDYSDWNTVCVCIISCHVALYTARRREGAEEGYRLLDLHSRTAHNHSVIIAIQYCHTLLGLLYWLWRIHKAFHSCAVTNPSFVHFGLTLWLLHVDRQRGWRSLACALCVMAATHYRYRPWGISGVALPQPNAPAPWLTDDPFLQKSTEKAALHRFVQDRL